MQPGGATPAPAVLARSRGDRAAAGRAERTATARSPQFERARAASLVGPGEYLLTGGIALLSKRQASRSSGAANSVFVFGQGGQARRPLRQGPPRSLRRISADAAAAVVHRPVAARARRHRFHLRARAAHGRPCRAGARSASSFATRSSSRARWSTAATGRTSSSIRRTTPGSARWGPPQHLAQARLRAAEEGIPVIRSTPTGISALIDATGRWSKSLPWRTAGVIDASLPPPAATLDPVRPLRQCHPAAARLRAASSRPLPSGGRGRYGSAHKEFFI